jgi:hypothetical protein
MKMTRRRPAHPRPIEEPETPHDRDEKGRYTDCIGAELPDEMERERLREVLVEMMEVR